jgi:hypothetical protein
VHSSIANHIPWAAGLDIETDIGTGKKVIGLSATQAVHSYG